MSIRHLSFVWGSSPMKVLILGKVLNLAQRGLVSLTILKGIDQLMHPIIFGVHPSYLTHKNHLALSGYINALWILQEIPILNLYTIIRTPCWGTPGTLFCRVSPSISPSVEDIDTSNLQPPLGQIPTRYLSGWVPTPIAVTHQSPGKWPFVWHCS